MNRSKRYNQVTFLGTHNSFCNGCTSEENKDSQIPYKECVLNQRLSIKEQLESGVNMLDIEIHAGNDKKKNNLIVCHGPTYVSKWAGRSSLEHILKCIVRDFCEKNDSNILTLYINLQGKLRQKDWANGSVKKAFRESGLDDYVYSYNEERSVEDTWPTIGEMLDDKKPVMVFGLVGKQNFKGYTNRFFRRNKKGEIGTNQSLIGWKAATPEDLSVRNLDIPLETGGSNRLFLLNAYASPRKIKFLPYLFGGNPEIAHTVNETVVTPLLVAAQHQLDQNGGQRVNWVWVDFFHIDSCAALIEEIDNMNSNDTEFVSLEEEKGKEEKKENGKWKGWLSWMM